MNALAGRFIEEKLMEYVPDDEWLGLNADPGAARLSLYRKIVRDETFCRQAVTSAELRWLVSLAQSLSNRQLVHELVSDGSTSEHNF